MKPVPMDKEVLVATLEDMRHGVAINDTLEGSIQFLLPYEGDPEGADFMVMASYRIGNSMGQGGVRLIGDTTPPDDRPQLSVAELHNTAELIANEVPDKKQAMLEGKTFRELAEVIGQFLGEASFHDEDTGEDLRLTSQSVGYGVMLGYLMAKRENHPWPPVV